MPRNIVIEGAEVTSDARDALAKKWRELLPKIRVVEIARPRKGGGGSKWDTLIRKIHLEYTDEDGDAEAFLLATCEEALEIAREDCRGARKRYLFTVRGETHPNYTRRPPLCEPIEEWIDGTDGAPETKDSESVAMLGSARAHMESAAAAQVRTMNAAAGLMEKFCTLSEHVLKPRGEAATAEANAQVRMVEIGNQLQVDLEQIRQEGAASERRHQTFLGLMKMFGLDGFDASNIFGGDFGNLGTDPPNSSSNGASSSSSNGASSSNDASSSIRKGVGIASAAEIRRIFGSKPEIAELLVTAHDTQDPGAAAALRDKYRTAFNFQEAIATMRITVGVLGVNRAIAFAKWINSLGIKAQVEA